MNPPNALWHVIERSQDDVITSVWSFNTQREAVDTMTEVITKQAEHNQAIRDRLEQLRPKGMNFWDEQDSQERQLRWSTFSVAQCTGSAICPACLGVRRIVIPMEQP